MRVALVGLGSPGYEVFAEADAQRVTDSTAALQNKHSSTRQAGTVEEIRRIMRIFTLYLFSTGNCIGHKVAPLTLPLFANCMLYVMLILQLRVSYVE